MAKRKVSLKLGRRSKPVGSSVSRARKRPLVNNSHLKEVFGQLHPREFDISMRRIAYLSAKDPVYQTVVERAKRLDKAQDAQAENPWVHSERKRLGDWIGSLLRGSISREDYIGLAVQFGLQKVMKNPDSHFKAMKNSL